MRVRLIALLLMLALLTGIACAEIDLYATPEPTSEPQLFLPDLSSEPLLEAPPMTLNCASALLLEPESGTILFEMNADTPRAVASVTKLMTILLTLEALDSGRIALDQSVTVSSEAAGMGGSQVLLDVGEVQTVSILLKSMIVGSANDAAVALAETLYGSEALCVDQMNRRAEQLSMTDTHFVNCTGLPGEGQHTTARDVARMSAAVFSHDLYFEYSQIWLDEVNHGDGRVTQLTNTNKLIRLFDGCDGGKTGSTNEAGCCLSATASRDGMRLIAVVLGAPHSADRFDAAKSMFDYGFANYRRYPVAERGTKVRGEMTVIGGTAASVGMALDGDLTLLIRKGDEQSIALRPNLPESVDAPVALGQILGTVDVIVDDRAVGSVPIAATEIVDSKGLTHNLRRIFSAWKFPT